MPIQTDPGPPVLDRPDDVNRVREVLDRAGFADRNVRERMATDETVDLSFGPIDRPRVLRRTRGGEPIDTLIRLFLAGVPVPLDDFRRAVAPMDPADWVALGLVERDGDGVRRRVGLLPCDGFAIAHDVPLPDSGERRDHVMGATRATWTFARCIMPVESRRTLDLGTGCGYVALLTSRHSRRVLATDVNARAVAMARFNAMLNRVDHVEVKEGDLFEPAGELRFDLIVSNPPFVISPQHELTYRDSGLAGDAFCERILREAPAHLAEGGFAQVICNWARIAGRDWLDRLSGWFAGSGCDVWISHWTTAEPGDYARNWLQQTDLFPSPERYAAEFDRWMAYYDRHRIEAIDFGVISLRRRQGRQNWLRVDTDRDPDLCSGVGFHRGFAAHDLMDRLEDPAALMEATFACPPELRVSQRLKPAPTGWMVDGADCRLGAGPPFEGEVSPMVFHLLTICRGVLPLSAVIAQVAGRLGRPVDEIGDGCLEAVRSLVLQGFMSTVEPAHGPPGGNGAPRSGPGRG